MISNPIGNGMYSLELNVMKPPFNNEKVRQAVAYALPYQKIIDAAMFGLANPLFGGTSNKVDRDRLAAADRLHQRHGEGQGADGRIRRVRPIETTISFDLGDGVISEPICRADPGEPRRDRHQDHDQQGAGRQLAQRDGQEDRCR